MFPLKHCLVRAFFDLSFYFAWHQNGSHLYQRGAIQRGVTYVQAEVALNFPPGSTTVHNSQILTATDLNSSQPDSD